jgi:hypothetical protein
MLGWSKEESKTSALAVRHFSAGNIYARGRSSWITSDMFLGAEVNPSEDDVNGGNSWSKAGLSSLILTYAACFGDKYTSSKNTDEI